MMTHEERMARALELNRKIAAGTFAGQIATRDLIRSDAITAEETAELVGLYPAWEPGIAYEVGDLFAYQGTLYEVVQAHTSQADWLPSELPALYKSKAPAAVIPEWKQPTMAEDAYQVGDKVTYNGQVYESLINGNTWSPEAYPQGWKLVP